MGRSLAVARVTGLELIRSRTLWVIVPILGTELAAWWLMSETHVEARSKTLLNATLLAINVFGLLGALTLAGGTIPRDIARRHLYFVFVKPLRNWEFLVGKALGLTAVLGAVVAVSALAMSVLIHLDERTPEVRARARVHAIASEVTGHLSEEGDLLLPFARPMPRGTWILGDAGPAVQTLQWEVPGLVEESRLAGTYRLHAGASVFSVAPIVVDGHVVLAIPEAARVPGLRLEVAGRRHDGPDTPMASVRGRPPVHLSAGPVDEDFEQGAPARMIVNLENIMPGGQWTLLVRRGEATVRSTIFARESNVVELPPAPNSSSTIDLEIVLVDGNRPAFNVTPKRIWVEGRQHPLAANVWRGFGIAWLQLSAVAIVALVGSVFLSQPTAMLLGFTFFVTAHNLSAFRELPEIMFLEQGVKPGQVLPTHVLEDAGFQAMSSLMDTLAALLPDFARFSPGTYFTRGEYLTMGAFWSELGAAVTVLAVCVVLGSLAVMRKEFLK